MPRTQPEPDLDDFGLPFGLELVLFGALVLAWAAIASPTGLTLSFALMPGESAVWPAATFAGGLIVLLGVVLWLIDSEQTGR